MKTDFAEGKSKQSCCGNCGSDKQAVISDDHGHDTGFSASQSRLVLISGLALSVGFLAKWFLPAHSWIATALFGMATIAGGILIFPHAFSSLRRLRLDMNVLMTVAVLGAWLVGEGAEGAAVVFLFSLAELLESWSVGRARRAIESCWP